MVVGPAHEDGAASAPAQSATDRAYHSLLRNILSGKYRAGERLTESRLTAEFGLSRITVREALQRLAQEGVIDLHRHRGASLRVITRSYMADFFDVRSMLEGTGAAAAAGRIRESSCDAERGRLTDHMAKLKRWADDVTVCDTEEYAEHNDQFHQLIIHLSGNQFLIKFWDGLQLPLQRLRLIRRYRLADLEASIDEHIRIAESILARDWRAAECYARNHTNRIAAGVYALSDHEFNLLFNPGIRSQSSDQATGFEVTHFPASRVFGGIEGEHRG